MTGFLLIGLFNTAQAGPTTGVRLGVCGGLATSDCHLAGVRLTGMLRYMSLSVSATTMAVSGFGQLYPASSKWNVRPFVYLGAGSVLSLYTGLGVDLHTGPCVFGLFCPRTTQHSRRFILTPRMGMAAFYGGNRPYRGGSLEMGYAF